MFFAVAAVLSRYFVRGASCQIHQDESRSADPWSVEILPSQLVGGLNHDEETCRGEKYCGCCSCCQGVMCSRRTSLSMIPARTHVARTKANPHNKRHSFVHEATMQIHTWKDGQAGESALARVTVFSESSQIDDRAGASQTEGKQEIRSTCACLVFEVGVNGLETKSRWRWVFMYSWILTKSKAWGKQFVCEGRTINRDAHAHSALSVWAAGCGRRCKTKHRGDRPSSDDLPRNDRSSLLIFAGLQ